MNAKEEEVPAGTVWTLEVPLDRDKSKQAIFYLKDMTTPVFMAAKDMLNKGKSFEAALFIIKSLRLGGDEITAIDIENFVAVRSASDLVAQILEPVEGELKKN